MCCGSRPLGQSICRLMGLSCWMCRSTLLGCQMASIWVWQAKHFLGAPYPGGDEATVNLAHVAAAVEFVDAESIEQQREAEVPSADEVVADLGRLTNVSEAGQEVVQHTVKDG